MIIILRTAQLEMDYGVANHQIQISERSTQKANGSKLELGIKCFNSEKRVETFSPEAS